MLSGFTGIGKSKVAIKIAKTLNTKIITADSSQVFLNIYMTILKY